MVVLEEGSMLTTGHNQYLQPDYLSPLPTTLDAKKSPLALLAQTCSQIGADSPTKPLITPMDKSSKGSSARSPPAAKLERTRSSPSDGSHNNNNNNHKSSANLAFKPYETNVVSTKRSSSGSSEEQLSRPASKASSVHSASGNSGPDSANNSASGDGSESSSSHKKSRSTPLGRKSASPATSQQQASATSNRSSPSSADRKTPADRDKSSASPRNSSSGASPVIRSGMEILSGQAGKDAAAAANLQNMYKAAAFGAANPLCCPPGLAENPAFRPPFAGASPFASHHHAAAAALLGYPGAGGSPNSNPYLSYMRVKTPSGGETLVPVCKDPYCQGCQYSMQSAQMMMAAAAAANSGASPSGACPSGCTQCDHQKYSLMALGSLGPMPPPSLAGYPSSLGGPGAAAAAAAAGRPHVCNWVGGDSYCGKRFATSEELLQHLRSHTNIANGADAAALLAAGQHSHQLLSSTAALHRAAAAAAGSYPAPSLSPLSARYHPYGKPPTGPMAASLAASPYSAFNALGGPYYSPYTIYGQRIGAAVHP
ncbi:zinc finger protein Noc [Nasonia vitripennis]|uniref:C2H2-type domain-containing protein n=1 Tax=Nasonia vitripennis TaxID=7425 RepID=A0A7M7G6Z4_NASVI|nr:zinc finger protein Noc [Nasonia vitripennis]